MAYHKVVSKFMSFSINSYYMWKKENRPIINFLEKYLSEDDMIEFINTGSVSKFENINNDFKEKYFNFIQKMDLDELQFFITLVKKNENNLTYFTSNFIELVIESKIDNKIKSKLIELFTNETYKLSFIGLKEQLTDDFISFYNFSLNYSRHDKRYLVANKHIKAHLKVFYSYDVLEIDELIPELKSKEFLMLNEYNLNNNYDEYIDFEDRYYNYLLKEVKKKKF